MKEEQQIVDKFIEARPVIEENNRDLANMGILLRAEFQELCEALEIGNPAEIAFEMVDLLWLILSICHYFQIDFNMVFKIKACRNELKRPAKMWQEGDYDEIDAEARRSWAERGGDEQFLQAIALLGISAEGNHANS